MDEEEALPLVGVGPAPIDGKGKQPKVLSPHLQPRPHINPNQMSKPAAASTEVRSFRAILEEEDRRILAVEPSAALVLVPLRRRALGWPLFSVRFQADPRRPALLDEDEFDDEWFRTFRAMSMSLLLGR